MDKLTKSGTTICGDKYYDAIGFGAIEQRPFFEIIKKLAHYENLEESGKLFATPYKLNDIVYIINEDNKVEETYIDGFEIKRLRDGFELFILIPICDDIRQTGYQTMLQSGVFLTREDAENKLKEMKK